MPQEFSRLARVFTALAGLAVLAGCGGGGGGGGAGPIDNGGCNVGGATVTVSGKITFDRLQFRSTPGGGLDGANPVESPAREVFVEAVACNSAVASTYTDANGDYSLSVPSNTTVVIRARAQMVKTGAAPTWQFTVRNNMNSDAVYALEGSSFNSGTANQTRNLRATSGWGGSSYTGTRAAAPFAILDTVYRTKQLILDASPTAQFPELNLFWSDQNREGGGSLCPDLGNIITSFYARAANDQDECATPTPLPDGIYILGDYANGNGDTDEFDQHVIAHEFGHYFEDRFSRSDSIGGEHSLGDRLDMRVAFGEGWGNAFGAMSLGDPAYRDSSTGISRDGGFNLETGNTVNEGWFSESSVGEFLWDVFDTTIEIGDDVPLGFAPIFAVMTDEQVDTPALTSIFSFASALLANNGGAAGNIRTLLTREEVTVNDAFGTGETDDGSDPGFTEVYTDIAVGELPVVCSTNGSKASNRLGNRRFLRFVKSTAGQVLIQATGSVSNVPGSAPAEDPDIVVHQQGNVLRIGQNTGSQETITGLQLAAGTYVIEVYAFETLDPDPETTVVTTPRCMSVSIQAQ